MVLNSSVVIYLGAGLAACALVLVGWVLGRRSSVRPHAVIQKQSAGSGRQSFGSVPHAGRATDQVARLEGHLRNAIFDPGARERLVKDAMRGTGGNRAAAIRKVLSDLEREDKRWS
jgi:hypothetical protein